ncbi:hypothetical protein AB2M62_11955 [Sphingomonas sp. MMS12-HWE2-04]|uniref:hypothetical protein n=1 Tax=Sphingomonas sp. MMS12-HWE2-04 TaxID=3234199 RepID=UPI00384E087F
MFLFTVIQWSSRHEARRERALGRPRGSLLVSVFCLLAGGAGSAFWTWKAIGALRTGQVAVASTPEVFTAWSTNPWGFVATLAAMIVGIAVFLVMFVGGMAMTWLSFARRSGRARA